MTPALRRLLVQVPQAGLSTSVDALLSVGMTHGLTTEAAFDRAFGHALRKGYIAISSPGWIHRLPAGDVVLVEDALRAPPAARVATKKPKVPSKRKRSGKRNTASA